MEIQKLREYLRIVVDMEKNVYMQDDILRRMEVKYSGLAIRRDIPPPIEPCNSTSGSIAVIGMSFLIPVIGYFTGEIGKALMMTGIIGGLIGVILAIAGILTP